MHDCPSWDLDLAWRVNVAGRRFEEKERLLWDGITQFKCVFRIVSTNGHDLFTCTCKRCHSYRERQKWKPDKGWPYVGVVRQVWKTSIRAHLHLALRSCRPIPKARRAFCHRPTGGGTRFLSFPAQTIKGRSSNPPCHYWYIEFHLPMAELFCGLPRE